jgi:YegS/Rv2252/BmrU family lipid kinase
LVLLNPNAGTKAPLAGPVPSAAEVVALLARHGLAAEVVVTESGTAAERAAGEAVQAGRQLVVAAGGDGTIGTVAAVLLDSPTALGILPLGSVMNVPRMLDLPRELEAAAAVLARGETRLIDVGLANGLVFYETASVGINAAIFGAAANFSEGNWRSMRRLLRLVFAYRPARLRLRIDDHELRTRALMVTVSNGPYAGIGMTVAPDARLDDGAFDVTIFRHFSKLELLRHLASISFGRRSYTPHTQTHRGAHVLIESRRPLPVRADSVDLGSTPLECRVRRACLRVVAPQSSSGRTQRE